MWAAGQKKAMISHDIAMLLASNLYRECQVKHVDIWTDLLDAGHL